MEFKGTKGKWWNPEFSREIISMPSQTKVAKSDGSSHEEAKANALLISKAPELLEMLQLWCMDMEERGHAYGDCYTMTKALIKSSTELK